MVVTVYSFIIAVGCAKIFLPGWRDQKFNPDNWYKLRSKEPLDLLQRAAIDPRLYHVTQVESRVTRVTRQYHVTVLFVTTRCES